MKYFLADIAREILSKGKPLEETVWVFPSKRAGVFTKDFLRNQTTQTVFAPEFYSIEEFITQLSSIELANEETALCLLYECYLETSIKEKDSFASFVPWGTTLLQDFNEIDRYGIVANKIYNHIQDLQEVSHWALAEEKTEMVKNYLKFWEQLPGLYEKFTTKMLKKGIGHQGLLYKKAFENIEDFLKEHPNKTIYFIGFNALNTSESKIIQSVLKHERGMVFWDIDQYFLENKLHEAGYFIRQHRKEWPYFQNNDLIGVSNSYSNEKEIQLYGVPKTVSQAHLIGHLLQNLEANTLKNTAVVLGDELLLKPLLHSLPENITANITMGYPLENKPMAVFFHALFEMQSSGEAKGWYVGHLKNILKHPIAALLIHPYEKNGVTRLLSYCDKTNITFITETQITHQLPAAKEILTLLFKDSENNPLNFLSALKDLLIHIESSAKKINNLELVSDTIYFVEILNALEPQLKKYKFIDTLKSFWKVYNERVSKQKLSFSGEALSGLQIMGMLESRNLDFETLIISHVNEGILPGGKSNNSYIPLSLKKEFGLPTFKEKDAVYAYHFYRLLQRAKKVYLLYNTATDALEGGEPSRFIYQLKTQQIPGVIVKENTAMPLLNVSNKTLTQIKKTPQIIARIIEKGHTGFSPSAINAYIRNPIDFYMRYVLGLREPEILEEIIAYNTFGTIVHDSLETLYKNFVGVPLTAEHFNIIISQIAPTLKHHYELLHSPLEGARGKNIIAYRVILKYLEDFVRQDQLAAAKESIIILGLEEEYSMFLEIPGMPNPVKFKGTVDRVESRNGHIQVIDFKTGMVQASALKLKDWLDLQSEPKMSKAFQLLAYAMLYQEKYPGTPVKAGIYSFKNTTPGIMYFEDSNAAFDKQIISTDTTASFKESLIGVIKEIFNLEVPFVEKEV